MSQDSHSSRRPVFVAGIIGAAIVITLMFGVTFLQAGSNVNEVSVSSTTSNLSSYSTVTQVGSSSSSTGSTSSNTYYGPTGILGVSLTDPPIVPAGVTDVFISYSSIEVHIADAGNQDGWYQVADAGSVDLMSLINVSLTLGSAPVQTGVFNLISFNITSAGITLNGVNETAYVPANRINLPIVGGISVSSGNSSGVLVDLSPQVVPYQNGTSVSYVLVPEAKSLPFPHNVWNHDLEVKGAKLHEIQNQTWVTNSTGQVVVSGVSLTPNSFSLTLQNQGNENVSFSSIVIGQVVSLPVCYATPETGASRPAVENYTYVSIQPAHSYFVGNQTVTLLGQVNPLPSSPNTSALVVVKDPNGNVVETINSSVELSGAFHANFTAGGYNSSWIVGTYNVLAVYNGTMGKTSFEWGPAYASTVSTSTTSSENHTTTFSSTTATTSTILLPPANITIMTNASSYFGNAGVLVYGTVTPPPTSTDYSVSLRIIGPNRAVVFNGGAPVGPNGTFSLSLPAGGIGDSAIVGGVWTNGTYTVYAYHEHVYAYTKFAWSGPSATVNYSVAEFTDTTETTSHINTTRPFQSSFCGLYGNSDSSKLPRTLSVAYYAILANGTLYPVNYTSIMLTSIAHHEQNNKEHSSELDISKSMLTYTLAPGQSVTFTYNGTVDCLTAGLLSYLPRNFAVPSSILQINPGMEYTVMASGPFDSRVGTGVNATA